MSEFKKEVITTNIVAREQEIAIYEINIANYEHVVNSIDEDTTNEDLKKHRSDMVDRLATERREMMKSQMILNGLRAQQGE